MNLQDLFRQVKANSDWTKLYPALQDATSNIAGNLRIPKSHREDVLHEVLASIIPKIKEIEHVGYILQTIRYECIRLIKEKNTHERKLNEIANFKNGIANNAFARLAAWKSDKGQ
jgi:hypothetical protein